MVSVIVPCYNQAEYLPYCINSLLSQTYSFWECVIINDGSTDNTESVAKSFAERDKRVRLYTKPNGGLSSARNYGITKAIGDFILFLDADDKIAVEKLRMHIEFFQRMPFIDIVYSGCRYFSNENDSHLYLTRDKSDREWQPVIYNDRDLFYKSLLSGNIMPCNSPIIRKSMVNKIGFFNEKLITHEDYDYWVRAALADANIWYCAHEKAFALIRIHEKSMSNNEDNMMTGFIQVRLHLLKGLLRKKVNLKMNLRYQMRSVKKHMVMLYMDGRLPKDILFESFSNLERIKFLLSDFLPERVFLNFLMFDEFEAYKFLRKYGIVKGK